MSLDQERKRTVTLNWGPDFGPRIRLETFNALAHQGWKVLNTDLNQAALHWLVLRHKSAAFLIIPSFGADSIGSSNGSGTRKELDRLWATVDIVREQRRRYNLRTKIVVQHAPVISSEHGGKLTLPVEDFLQNGVDAWLTDSLPLHQLSDVLRSVINDLEFPGQNGYVILLPRKHSLPLGKPLVPTD